MNLKLRILYIIIVILIIPSCNTFDSVKRGLTGEKSNSADEFLVQKKDPLVLPPNYDKLPTPNERRQATEELSVFEKSLEFKDISLDNVVNRGLISCTNFLISSSASDPYR